MVTLQFFVYYVLWPFVLGMGIFYTALMLPGKWVMWWAVGWLFPWVVWPVGRCRRRFQKALLDEFEEECHREEKINRPKAVALGIGPALILILAAYTGAVVAPVAIENFLGINVDARIEEIQKHVKRDRHP